MQFFLVTKQQKSVLHIALHIKMDKMYSFIYKRHHGFLVDTLYPDEIQPCSDCDTLTQEITRSFVMISQQRKSGPEFCVHSVAHSFPQLEKRQVNSNVVSFSSNGSLITVILVHELPQTQREKKKVFRNMVLI